MSDTSNQNSDESLSPCVRNCCLDNHDICLGCYRSLAEIVSWRKKSRQQQQAVLVQCDQRRQN